jgi:hypothetical protein
VRELGAAGALFGASTKLTEYAIRFGVPDPALVMTPRVAPLLIAVATTAGEEVGFCCKYRATTPATCGAAIDVPDIDVIAVFEEIPADVIDWPGANKSTHVPQLENDARESIKFDAATVMALGALAGE